MKYVKDIESHWLIFYFGTYLTILMGVYLLFALRVRDFPYYGFGLLVFLLAFLSFLLVCTTHEIGHFVALRLKNYEIFAIQVFLFFIPIGVKHTKWRSSKDVTVVCLLGPITGVVGSVVLGCILFLFSPVALLLVIIMVFCAIALGYRDYKDLLSHGNPKSS